VVIVRVCLDRATQGVVGERRKHPSHHRTAAIGVAFLGADAEDRFSVALAHQQGAGLLEEWALARRFDEARGRSVICHESFLFENFE
jgi:hypothetical protein